MFNRLFQAADLKVYAPLVGHEIGQNCPTTRRFPYVQPYTRFGLAFRQRWGKVITEDMIWGYAPAWVGGWQRLGRAPWTSFAADNGPTSRAFRYAWRYQRCLIPADGLDLDTGEHLRFQNGSPMLLCAVWDYSFRNDREKEGEGFALVRVPALASLGMKSEWMPLILPPEACVDWLSPLVTEPMDVRKLVNQATSDRIQVVGPPVGLVPCVQPGG